MGCCGACLNFNPADVVKIKIQVSTATSGFKKAHQSIL